MPLVARHATSFLEKRQKVPSHKHLMDVTQKILTNVSSSCNRTSSPTPPLQASSRLYQNLLEHPLPIRAYDAWGALPAAMICTSYIEIKFLLFIKQSKNEQM